MLSYLLVCLFGAFAYQIKITKSRSKLDDELYKALVKKSISQPEKQLRIIGESALPINPRIRFKVQESGVELLTISQNNFIAIGKAEQILRLSEMNLVKSLRLSVLEVVTTRLV